jgi:hypothetical protein
MKPTNTTTPHETLEFPRLSESPAHTPWSPVLAGEGEFPEHGAVDAIELAQRALDQMEAGMLKLHKAIDDDDPRSHPPKAA